MQSVLPKDRSVARRAALALRAAVLLAFAAFFVVPLVWLVLAPTKTDYELITRNPLAVGSLHNVWVAWQHLNAFGNHLFWRWMENSVLYALSGTAIALVTVIPAGYGLAIGSFRGRKLILTLTLIAIVMPAASLVLPTFLELNAMGLIGSVFSIILPFAFFPFGVYLAYIYYATALPTGLLDAARIDGCSEWAAFRLVGIPLARPIIALIVFFSFVANWNNFFLPYVILPNENRVSSPGGAFGHLRIDPADARARDADRGSSGDDRVHRLATSPRSGTGRRRNQGVSPGSARDRRDRARLRITPRTRHGLPVQPRRLRSPHRKRKHATRVRCDDRSRRRRHLRELGAGLVGERDDRPTESAARHPRGDCCMFESEVDEKIELPVDTSNSSRRLS